MGENQMTREEKARIIVRAIDRYGAPGCIDHSTDLLLMGAVMHGLAEIQEAEKKEGAEE